MGRNNRILSCMTALATIILPEKNVITNFWMKGNQYVPHSTRDTHGTYIIFTLWSIAQKEPGYCVLSLVMLYLLNQVYRGSYRTVLVYTTLRQPEKLVCESMPEMISCQPHHSQLLGVIGVNTTVLPWVTLNRAHPTVELGGRWKPSSCYSCNHVAIVIPYRDRDSHLRAFLHHMHPILQRQMLDYGIFVIEQDNETDFNRGVLMNIGFVEASRQSHYQCFVFSDVDLLPEDDRNIYGCPIQPRHLSVAVDTLNYELFYPELFGGVENFQKEHFEKINGFSNLYFGWGGEDDDIYNRVHHAGYQVIRPPIQIARYTMNHHGHITGNHSRYKSIINTLDNWRWYLNNGLSSLKYKIVRKEVRRLYTLISVQLDQDQILQDAFRQSNEEASFAMMKSRDIFT